MWCCWCSIFPSAECFALTAAVQHGRKGRVRGKVKDQRGKVKGQISEVKVQQEKVKGIRQGQR